MKQIRLSEFPPILEIEGHLVYAASGDIVYCYRLELPETLSVAEKDLDAMHETWYMALKNISPPAIVLKQDVFLARKFDSDGLSALAGENYFQTETRQHFSGRQHMVHYPFLFFIKPKGNILHAPNIRNPFMLPVPASRIENLLENQKVFLQEVNRSVAVLNASRFIKAIPLGASEINYLSQLYFNGFSEGFYSDANQGQSVYELGDRKAGAFVLNNIHQLPEGQISNCTLDQDKSNKAQFFVGFVDQLGLKIKGDHLINQVFYLKGHHGLKKQLVTRQKQLFAARKFDQANATAAEDLNEYLIKTSRDESIRLTGFHWNTIFFADDQKQFMTLKEKIAGTLTNMDLKCYYPKNNNLSNIYNNSFFGHTSFLDKANIFNLELQQAICLMPQVSGYKNDEEGLVFNDRMFNIPIVRDVWDEPKKRTNARNFFVVAPTGEGKSVLVCHMIRQYFEAGHIIILLDLGDSYWKLTQLLREYKLAEQEVLYIKYQEGQPLGINPFYLAKGETLSLRKQNELVNFVLKLWKKTHLVADEQRVSLRKIIGYYYDCVKVDHAFPSFYFFVEQYRDFLLSELEIDPRFFDIKSFLHSCSEYIPENQMTGKKKGAYSFLFEGDTNIDVKGKKLVVLEMDNAKNDPVLISLLLDLSSELINTLIWNDKETKGVLLFEEFAKFLKYPNILNAVEYYYQAIRKQTACIGVVLQSPTQLPEEKATASIIENTQVLYILPNKNGYEHVMEYFKLEEHDRNHLISMRNHFHGQPKYSELYLRIGTFGNVVRLELPEALRLAFITDGEENQQLLKAYEKAGNLHQAIQQTCNLRQLAEKGNLPHY